MGQEGGIIKVLGPLRTSSDAGLTFDADSRNLGNMLRADRLHWTQTYTDTTVCTRFHVCQRLRL